MYDVIRGKYEEGWNKITRGGEREENARWQEESMERKREER